MASNSSSSAASAAPSPPGVPPFPPGDLDTSTQTTGVIAAWVIMTVVAGVTVGLRFYTRRVIIRVLGVEDWMILVAMILSIGSCIGFVRQTFSALGHHIWTLSPDQLRQWSLEQWYTFLFYTLSLAFTKLSILFLYTRILVHGPLRLANWIVLGIVTLCNIWVFISSFVGCIPLAANWDPTVPGAKCIGIAIPLGNSILHVITDFMIFCLPIPALVKLQIHWRAKVALLGVFSLGFFVCLVSLIRIVSITRMSFEDVTYKFSVLAYWGAVEVNLAIICACLTTLKPLVARVWPKLLASTRGTTYRGGQTGAKQVSVGGSSFSKGSRPTVVGDEEGHVFTRLDDGDKAGGFKEEAQKGGYELGQGRGVIVPESKAHETLGLR